MAKDTKERILVAAYSNLSGMMDKGLIRRDDPAMVAFAYTAPISVISDCVTSYDLKKMDESSPIIQRRAVRSRHWRSI